MRNYLNFNRTTFYIEIIFWEKLNRIKYLKHIQCDAKKCDFLALYEGAFPVRLWTEEMLHHSLKNYIKYQRFSVLQRLNLYADQ